jgi:hypothetical protein
VPVTYYALDLERREIPHTLKDVSRSLGSKLDGQVGVRGMERMTAASSSTHHPAIQETIRRVPLTTLTTSEDSRTPRPSSPTLSEPVIGNRTTSDSALFTEQGQASTFSSRPEQEQERKSNGQTFRSPSPNPEFGDQDSAAAQPPLYFKLPRSSIGDLPRSETKELPSP